MNETWRVIPGFPDYAVSDCGRVRRETAGRKTVPGKILRSIRTGAYRGFALVRSGFVYRQYAHRLVMLAFVGAPPIGHEVNHKDGNKENNALANLEYVTRSGNIRHARATGLVVDKRGADHWAWKGGPPPHLGRPTGDKHWTRRKPDLVARGELSGKNKLTASQVASIRARVTSGERQSALAAEFGMSRAQICRIVNGARWA